MKISKKTVTWKNIILVGTILYIINKIFKDVDLSVNTNSSLDDLRNFGFYVDLSHENNWRSPSTHFSSKDYTSLSLKVNLLVTSYFTYFEEISKNKQSTDKLINILVNGNLVNKDQLAKINRAKEK